jgi:hypothetical protein
MCVISVCEFARLTDEQVELQWDANPHGGGAAWRDVVDVNPDTGQPDTDENGNPVPTRVVRWTKGKSKEEMVQLNRTLPLPYILHFRVPSSGTSQAKQACHPFAINAMADCYFDGVTTGGVLFHNGHWNGWKDKLQNISMNRGFFLPSGPWSDSRGLAWAAYHLGPGFVELVDEKIAILGPGEYDVEIMGSTWNQIKAKAPDNTEVEIYVSNKGWEKTYTAPTQQHHGAFHHRNRAVTDVATTPPVRVTDHRNPNLPMIAAGISGAVTPPATDVSRPGGAAESSDATFRTGVAGSHAAEGRKEDHQESVSEANSGPARPNLRSRETTVGASNDSALRCSVCRKATAAGNFFNDAFHCWQCWSAKTQTKPLVGQCHRCRVQYAGCKTEENHTWLCNPCWETNGKPPIYWVAGRRDKVLEGVVADG